MANYKTVTTQIQQKSHEDTSQLNKQHNITKKYIYTWFGVMIKYLNSLGQTAAETVQNAPVLKLTVRNRTKLEPQLTWNIGERSTA